VQELLGIRPSTFYKWHTEGKIKGGVKSGKYWRFKRSEIEKLIQGD
ncbi:MAG: helix-turn-helix domain-containing protein, partial [Synergistaceae bacterium]|nr:helix-turn-helix domain-containing protein [Synergistaceae bacterium]